MATLTLTLKARIPGPDGNPRWHDYHVIQAALTKITEKKSLVKLAPWIQITGLLQDAAEEVGFGKRISEPNEDAQTCPHCGRELVPETTTRFDLPNFSIEVGGRVAHLFWKELEALPFEGFGPGLSNIPALYKMLADIATQLGEKFGEEIKEEPEEDLLSN